MDTLSPFLEWHHTAEGETFLQQLYNVKTTGRKLFGILEKPFQGSNLEEVCYKLVFIGKTGIGKTSTINRLSGFSCGTSYFETPGIQITDVYWPIKIWDKVILFKLQCWDAGNNCMKKYNHIPVSCIDKADFIVFVFSFSDGGSFLELTQLINKFVINNEHQPGCIVIGMRLLLPSLWFKRENCFTKIHQVRKLCKENERVAVLRFTYVQNLPLRFLPHKRSYFIVCCGDKLKIEVTKCEIKEFEQKHNVRVLSIQTIPYAGSNEAIKIAPILSVICEQLWLRDQQFILKQGINV